MKEIARHAERFFSLSLDMLCIAGFDGYFRHLNPAWQKTLGFTVEELLVRPYMDFIHPDDRERTASVAAGQERGEDAIFFENRYLCKDGSYKWLLWQATQCPEEKIIYAVARDVTEVKKRNARIETRLELILDSAGEGIYGVDQGGNVTFVNQAASRMLKIAPQDMMGRPEHLLVHRKKVDGAPYLQEECPVYETVHGGAGRRITGEVYWRPDGTSFPVEYTTSPMRVHGQIQGAVVIFRDQSERLKVEAESAALRAQLVHAQKLEAVGRLAGGVAHDFNNILTAISGYAHFLINDLPPGDPRREDALEILKSGERAAALTRQLLVFSRQQVLQEVVLDPVRVLTEMEKLIRRLIGEDILLSLRTGPEVSRIKGDPGQIEQVIMNLVVNARDAMPRGGKLVLEASDVVLGEEYASTHPEVSPGPYVMLAVSDTGSGMTPEIMARIFEPFFTTKEAGKGTGLGLATVYGIVKKSRGSVFVYSEPGRGTTFKVYFPAVCDEADPARPRAPSLPPARGWETVLLVEDDELVRKFVQRVLIQSGYSVLAAENPAEALRISRETPGEVHLLLTDLVMPGMRGDELAAKVAADRPKLKFLYMSGYTEMGPHPTGVSLPPARLIPKPIEPELLARAVRRALDGQGV